MSLLRRSGVLVMHRFARALFMVGLSALVSIAFAVAFELWAHFLLSYVLQLGDPIDTLIDNYGSWPTIAGWLLASPFLALARLFDYVDARTRLDGWDIQVRFKAISSRAAEKRLAA
jgi:hypothetical protein